MVPLLFSFCNGPLSIAISKAVIMARGLGTRMRRADPDAALTTEQAGLAERGVKGMIPVGRPFIEFLLSALADAGFTDVCLVIGPEHDAVRRYTDALNPQRVRISHAIQAEPRGTADAVAAAEAFAGGDAFLVINSDNYYPLASLLDCQTLEGPGLVAFSARAIVQQGGVPLERIAPFPRVETDAEGFLSALTVNPAAGDSGYLSMNCWRLGPAIFTACRAIVPSPRGELELPDAVNYSRTRLGERYRVLRSDDPVFDLSSRGDIARVTRQLERVVVRL